MAAEDILLRLRLQGQRAVNAGLTDTAQRVKQVGKASSGAGGELGHLSRQSDRSARSFSTLRAGTRGVHGSIGVFTRGVGGAVAAVGGLYAVGAGLKFALGEAGEAAKVGAQTTAVLKSTGGAAGITAKHVGDLATTISNYAGIDDEAIQSGENLLLTFTNVRNAVGKGNKIFDQATVAATNMSVALGQDMKSSVLQLGKALNDPVKGITALQRVGVSFDAKTKDQIKTLVAQGKTLEAQRIILRELNKEFGGSAAAQATPMAKLKVTIGNIAETIGTQFLPYVNKAASALNTFLKQMQSGQGAGGKFVAIMRGIGAAIGTAFRTAVPIIASVVAKIRELVQRYGPGVVRFGASLVATFRQAVGPIRPVVTALALVGRRIMQIGGFVARVLRPALAGAAVVLRGAFEVVGGVIRTITALIHGDFSGALRGIGATVRGVRDSVVGAFHGMFGVVKNIAGRIGHAFASVLKVPINAVIGALNSIHLHVPGFKLPGPLPDFGGFDVDPFNIPKLAKGTRNHRGGPAIVGERGPELANLPKGTQVVPNHLAFPRSGALEKRELHVHLNVDGREVARKVFSWRDLEAAFA